MSLTEKQLATRARAAAILADVDRMQVHKPDTVDESVAVSAIAAALESNELVNEQLAAVLQRLHDAAIQVGLIDSPRELNGLAFLGLINHLVDSTMQRQALASGINEAAKAAGMLRAEVQADGPLLLQLTADMGAEVTRLATVTQITPETYEAARDQVAQALGTAYDCTRTWSAWSHGTMGPNDFVSVADDAERLDEITRAALAGAGLSVPEN